MVDALGRCMVCGGAVGSGMWVCSGCCESYGLRGSWREWPEWARQLKRDHERARIGELRRSIYESDSTEAQAVADVACYGEASEDHRGC